MPYLSEEELSQLGFKSLGSNVQISSLASIYHPDQISIGSNVRIDDFCVLSGNISIGDYVHLAAQVIMTATIAGIEIGKYSTLSYRVSVFSASDDFKGAFFSNPTLPAELRNVTHAQVKIAELCTVGAHSVIMPGSNLRTGTSYGSLSFISGDFPEWSLYAGAPARKIGERERPPWF